MRYFTLALLLIALPTQAAQNLRILLTNDDGFESPGIQALHSALTDAGHTVYLIAPATQQSGASASVTSRGVRVTPYPDRVWAVEGKPADAVRVALGNLLFDNPPDLVISGANFGQNTGQDVNVSGTVGAALTAYRLGVPAIAISVGIKLEEADRGFPSTIGAFSGAARLLVRLISNLELQDLTGVLNVNYPAALPLDVRGVRWSKLSDHSILGKRYERRADGTYAPELKAPYAHARKNDAESLVDGYVTLTFLDGNPSVPTRRAQKYLDRYLLDRNYEEAAPVARPVARPKPQPVTKHQPQPVVRQRQPKPAPPTSVPDHAKDDQVVDFEPAPAAAPLTVPRSEPSTSIRMEDEVVAVPAATTRVDEPLTETKTAPEPEQPAGAPAAAEQPRKKKPDSWLRRMFDPKSWRR